MKIKAKTRKKSLAGLKVGLLLLWQLQLVIKNIVENKKNIAQNKTFLGRHAYFAVDGDFSTGFLHCTRAQKDSLAWWTVDLEDEYEIKTVVFTIQCMQNHIANSP